MNPKLKLTAYAVLLILCAWFAWGFYSNTNTVTAVAPDTDVTATPGTNAPTAQTNLPTSARPATSKPAPARDESSSRSAMIGYLAALVVALIGLGLLITIDVTHFMGSQTIDFLFDDGKEGPRDPDYERAEAEWANGKFLDAIQMMRDFLKKNPRGLYAALRIAEIYEKDLKNPLAAALEYEEVLKHRLPAERWGWTAVHLCNLYSRLNQTDQSLALLHRIADEYPKTQAAKKARARLGIAEPEPAATVEQASPEAEPESTEQTTYVLMEENPPELEPRQESPPPPKPPEPPKSSLPPGFRSK
jgi:hypothetical protein